MQGLYTESELNSENVKVSNLVKKKDTEQSLEYDSGVYSFLSIFNYANISSVYKIL